jgi:hypothetical protein
LLQQQLPQSIITIVVAVVVAWGDDGDDFLVAVVAVGLVALHHMVDMPAVNAENQPVQRCSFPLYR